MYRTKEKERERAKWASLDLRAMRVGDRCHARSFLFFFFNTIVLTRWQVDDALFL